MRAFSILAFIEPCGLWQVTHPSREASCSNTYGPPCAVWHFTQDSFRLAARPHSTAHNAATGRRDWGEEENVFIAVSWLGGCG